MGFIVENQRNIMESKGKDAELGQKWFCNERLLCCSRTKDANLLISFLLGVTRLLIYVGIYLTPLCSQNWVYCIHMVLYGYADICPRPPQPSTPETTMLLI